jgi:hypothetical protein
MRLCVVPNDGQRIATSCRPTIRLGLALLVLIPAGCPKGVRPGVTYTVAILAKGNDDKTTPQGPVTRVESVGVEYVQEIPYEGQMLSLVVRKTQYGKATFDITFPDNAVQTVQVKVGQPKDILPKGQSIGVRIEVQESH